MIHRISSATRQPPVLPKSTNRGLKEILASTPALVAIGFTDLTTGAFAQSASPPPPPPSGSLAPLVVTANRDDESYPVTDATTATLTDTPIQEIPLSIQVIPRSVIEDQGVFRLKDTYRNVSSVAPVKTEGSGIQFENALIRGFSQQLALDGVTLYTMAPVNLAGVERVEVLKGPASSLYGAIEPGGLINALPRVSSFNQGGEAYGEVGSFDYYRGGFTTTGLLGQDAAFSLAGDFQDNHSFRDFLENRSLFIAPSVTWNISKQTQITSWMWYQDLERPNDNGVVFTSDGQPTGSISRNLAGPYHNTQDIGDFLYSLKLDHEVNDDLTVSAKFLMHNFDAKNDSIRWSPSPVPTSVSPYLDHSSFENWQYNLLIDSVWKFELGETRHQLVTGIQADLNDYTYSRLTAPLPVIDALNPVYPTGPYNFVPGAADQKTLTKSLGLFAQEQMDAFDDRLHVMLGGRVDYIDQFYRRFSDGSEFNQYDTGLTGRVGVAYDIVKDVTAYTNISRSFNPNTAGGSLGSDGDAIDPTTGIQYEAGLKFALLDDRLSITSSVYQITKDNVPVSDPYNPGFSLNGGELRSQGVELDLLGQLTSNVQLIGNYSYDDTKVIDSSNLPIGARFANVPLQMGSLWLKYNFTDGLLKNLGIGLGVFASGSKPVDNNNTFDLPGYARFDAGMWYLLPLDQGREMKFQLNVLNLFDTDYYESAASTASVQPGTPSAIYAKCSLIF